MIHLPTHHKSLIVCRIPLPADREDFAAEVRAFGTDGKTMTAATADSALENNAISSYSANKCNPSTSEPMSDTGR